MDDPRPDDLPEIADAEALFRDDGPARAGTPPPSSVGARPVDSYDIEDLPDRANPFEAADPPPTLAPAAQMPTRPERPPLRHEEDPVEQVWTRGAEWGRTLLGLAASGLFLVVLLYGMVSAEWYGLAFLTLLFGGVGMAVLGYPILITLERPVRVTPEQALRDYYGALSHHAPHYRRMWLLLSRAGRFCGSYGSFEGFTAYWKGRLGELRAGRASGFTPLKFVVEDFKSEKSAGKSALDVSYAVSVFVRGRQAGGPVETVRVEASLVKGPDKMWYLDHGTLP